MGKLIVLEGLDGSGKATQAQLLFEALQQRGERVRKVTFPDYDSSSSALVKMYLAGQFGQKPGDVNAYAASAFYAVDRFASFKKDWGVFYSQGGAVLADRYTTSNAVHQCSKLPRGEWDGFLAWLFDFEYEKMGIPRPDTVIYLDVAPDVSQKLMAARYHGDASKKDIHERDVAYLERSREAAEYCVRACGWKRVACTCGGEMRGIQDISAEVLRLVLQADAAAQTEKEAEK